MIVTSFFPGRIRLRAEVFKNPEIVEHASKILKKFPALSNLETNLRTGSVLLEYDPNLVPFEELTPIIPLLNKLQTAAEKTTFNKEQIILMLNELEKEISQIV